MENLSLAIVTEDREYGKALGLAMLNTCSSLVIKLFYKDEFFRQRKRFYSGAEDEVFRGQFGLILWDGEEAETVYGGNIVLLSGKLFMAVKDFSRSRFCLYKYSPAQGLVSSLFEIYSFLTGKRVVNIRRQKVHMLAFVACSGGAGCTSLAMAVGQELCRFQGKRVLYLSFEEIESTGGFIRCPAGVRGAGVYLYHLFKGGRGTSGRGFYEKKGHPFLESYLVRDDFGLEAFAPTGGRNPLRELTLEELGLFIASLIDCGRYDILLMDLGNCISKTGIACIEMAEKICLVGKGDQQEPREVPYLQHLICRCGQEVTDRMVKTRNVVHGIRERDRNIREDADMIETQCYIGKNENMARKDGISRILLEGAFGAEIKGLAEKMMEPLEVPESREGRETIPSSVPVTKGSW